VQLWPQGVGYSSQGINAISAVWRRRRERERREGERERVERHGRHLRLNGRNDGDAVSKSSDWLGEVGGREGEGTKEKLGELLMPLMRPWSNTTPPMSSNTSSLSFKVKSSMPLASQSPGGV
jgi:hypothetical protein